MSSAVVGRDSETALLDASERTGLPLQGLQFGFYKFTIDQYLQIIESGILTKFDEVELIEGFLINKAKSRAGINKNPNQLAVFAGGEQLPSIGLDLGFYRQTVDQYHQMMQTGIFKADDKCELIEGCLVNKMSPRYAPHDRAITLLNKILVRALTPGWDVQVQCAVTLGDSEPEPDFAVMRDRGNEYSQRHPRADELALVIEVSDSTLASDRKDKQRIYARAGIPEYWIVNIPEERVEVYTEPRRRAKPPIYSKKQTYQRGKSVIFTLDGKLVREIPVNDILPENP